MAKNSNDRSVMISFSKTILPGQHYDSDIHMYYSRARYYDPSTGRFMSRDPDDGNVSPAGLNKYINCVNNPVMHTDPTGMTYMLRETV